MDNGLLNRIGRVLIVFCAISPPGLLHFLTLFLSGAEGYVLRRQRADYL